MAIYHLSMKTIARSAGRSSTAAAAYRAGCKIADARTGEVHDYRRRRGVEMTALYMPGGQQVDRAALWSAVEQHHKRGDAVVAREIEVALPAELSREQRQRLAQGYGHELAQRYGVAVDVCVHAPDRRSDERNYHAHILLSGCSVATDGTLGKKAVELDPIHCARHKIESAADRERARWADLCNDALARDGHSARIDHRSHAERGIERRPLIHLGPDAAGYERRTGQPSHKRLRERERSQQQQRQRQERQGHEREIDGVDVTITGLEQELGRLQEQDRQERQALAEISAQMRAAIEQWQQEREQQAAAAEQAAAQGQGQGPEWEQEEDQERPRM